MSTGQPLAETHILDGNLAQWVVRVDKRDPRSWLSEAPNCPALGQYQIAHVGVWHTRAPFRVVRTHLSGTYFMACFAGKGKILVDGRWKTCGAGMACLLPPHTLNAFHAVADQEWRYCWVRYQQPPEQQPIASVSTPVLARYDCQPLRAAILGLHYECAGASVPSAMHHWVELIQTYVLRFAQPLQEDFRLWHLWENVAANLAEHWTLEKLAGKAHMSGEHLRRLCHRQLGRSPMHHVTHLRMRQAVELLASTDEKIESIALAVGYASPFAFSNAFKQSTGWRPSEYPGRKASR
jgi:AraC-like DNA-binding protein